MTLDEFIILQKINLEKFRAHHNQGVRKFNWPIDQSYQGWEDHWYKWNKIWDKWLKECREDVQG